MVYSMGRAQTISLYFVLEPIMPRRENCTSTYTNQIRGLDGQNGDYYITTAVMVVGGSSNYMSVTVRMVSNKKNLIDGVDLIQVTNCRFYMKNY